MHNRQTGSYLNLKTPLEMNLDEERQAMLEEQKLHRIRAQKLSIETNRRRKAQEEKRREDEEKEQKFRETILQQRKQKLQEVTEKFQRGHLPPSERRRTVNVVPKKSEIRLEDALNQIQGSTNPIFYNFSNNGYFNHTRIWNLATVLQPTSKLAGDKTFQEKSPVQTDSNQLYFQHKLEEAQRLLQEQRLSNLQNFHHEVKQLAHSESLTSLDSLDEDPDLEPDYLASDNLEKAFSAIATFPTDNVGIEVLNKYQDCIENVEVLNGQSRTSNQLLITNKMAKVLNVDLNDSPTILGNKQEGKTDRECALNGILLSQNSQNSATGNIESREKMSNGPIDYSQIDYQDNSTYVLGRPSKAWTTPEPAPTTAAPTIVSQVNKETSEHSEKTHPSQPLATPVVIPFVDFVSSCHDELNNSNPLDKINSVAEKENLVTINNIERCSIKSFGTPSVGLLVHESPFILSNLDHQYSEVPLSLGSALTYTDSSSSQCKKVKQNSSEKDENGFLKGILKKGSKYELGYSRAVGIGKMLQTEDKETAAIRDSIELIKDKDHKKTRNKKLRWLDEIDKIRNEINLDLAGSPKSIPSEPSSSMNHEALDLALPCSGTKPTEVSNGNEKSLHSTGYHIAKPAWLASNGVEPSGAAYGHSNRSAPKGKTKLIKRPKSAKNPSAITHRYRKGTIIRPQSACEASKILKSQGKIMMPHPPPRNGSDSSNSSAVVDGKNQTPKTNLPQAENENNVVPYQKLLPTSRNLSSAHAYNVLAFEPSVKSVITSNNDRVFALQESLPVSDKRNPLYGENGIRLDHTPTDEEIAVLWRGVQTALTHKNGIKGDFQSSDHYLNIQPAKNNLSHVVIDGGNLLNNAKSYSRINGYFSPPSNGHIALTRRKQILDSNENKHRALIDQRRIKPNSADRRPQQTELQNEHTVKISPFATALESEQTRQAASNEVSESTVQFLLAENMVKTSATEREILAMMQAAQINKTNLPMHRAQNTCLSALSLEEQRILQSLDRLNQRLQSK
ncbi:hypothetical protein GDO86_004688 [Hymenochirus boettgeri]|uniref:Centrosomal protein of 126 kDa n=1 Tax=Hymenochirus boettgeri TaxID=247094 RepID=A0A8T2K9P9_9PIPI|nr:hypothetical protein GDO86_004688 [Hymenochirus boettgeri]